MEIQGETLRGGIADHPAFANVVRTYAALFDLQHAPESRNILTYPSPTTGDPVATSFLIPRTREDLDKRGQACKLTADASFGMLGRTGDYLNSALMALASARRVVRPDRRRVRRQHHQVLRAGPRAGPALHPHPHPPAGQPRAARQPAGRRRPHGAHRRRGRQRHRRARRADARHHRPVRRRAAGLPLDRAARHAGGQALLVRVRDPDRREGPAVHRPGAVRLRPQPLRPPARLPLRRVRRGGGLRRRARPLRALLHARRPRDLQRLLHQDGRHRST